MGKLEAMGIEMQAVEGRYFDGLNVYVKNCLIWMFFTAAYRAYHLIKM